MASINDHLFILLRCWQNKLIQILKGLLICYNHFCLSLVLRVCGKSFSMLAEHADWKVSVEKNGENELNFILNQPEKIYELCCRMDNTDYLSRQLLSCVPCTKYSSIYLFFNISLFINDLLEV